MSVLITKEKEKSVIALRTITPFSREKVLLSDSKKTCLNYSHETK